MLLADVNVDSLNVNVELSVQSQDDEQPNQTSLPKLPLASENDDVNMSGIYVLNDSGTLMLSEC